MKDLQGDKIYACGTIRKTRKEIPKDLTIDKCLKRGESDWRVSTDGLAFTKWKDRKAVYLLSNYHNPSINRTAMRKEKDGSRQEVVCPEIVVDYNKHMGYVDKTDMLKALYEIDRKSKKWWHRLIWYFLDLAVLNSFIIFRYKQSTSTLSLKKFRQSVVSGLVGVSSIAVRKRGRPGPSASIPVKRFRTSVPTEKRHKECAHMPKHASSRRCAHCSTRDDPHRTIWMCSTCEVPLCLSDKRNCYKEYHNK